MEMRCGFPEAGNEFSTVTSMNFRLQSVKIQSKGVEMHCCNYLSSIHNVRNAENY
jgi:hypothetical protein